MDDQKKTKAQLLGELAELRRRVTEQDAELARTRQAEAGQRQIDDRLPVLVATAGMDGYYRNVNAAFERVLGWSNEEAFSRPFLEFVHPDERAAAAETFERLKAGETITNFVDRMFSKDGSYRWIRWMIIPVSDRDVIFGIGQDITEQRSAEEERIRNEAQWRSLIGNAPVFVAVLDPEDRIVFLNRAAPGMTVEDAIGRKTYDYIQPEYASAAKQAIDKVRRDGGTARYECVGTGPDGELSWYETHVGPIVVENEVVGVSLVALDITEQKRADSALRESERRLSTLASNLPGMAYTCLNDSEWTMQFVSEGAFQLTGYCPADILQNRIVAYGDLIHEADRTAVWQRVQQAIAERERFQIEYRIRTAEGKEKWVWEQGVGVFSDDGELQSVEGFITDVSDRKRAVAALWQANDELETRVARRTAELEAANRELQHEVNQRQQVEDTLRESEERYRTLIEAAPDAVVLSDLKGKVLFGSQRAVELLGFDSHEELCACRTADFVVEHEHPRLIENLANLAEQGVRRYTEYTGVRRDGTLFPVEVSSVLVRDKSGAPKGIMAVVRDITERKRAHEALEKSEAVYRALIESCPDAVIMCDLTGRVVFVSQEALKLYGADREDELCGAEATQFVIPEERQQARKNMASLLREGMRRNTQYTFLRKDGSRLPGELSSAIVRDGDGRPQAFMAVARDITERKQAQAALERERRTLLHMLRASDQERQVIAYDIHDGLTQQLAAAIMQFQACESLKSSDPTMADTVFKAGVQMVQQAHFEARRLISGVRPPILDEAGITAAIAHLVYEHSAQTGPNIEFHSGVRLGRLDKMLENALYRIAQESLANAVRHSGSEEINVSLLQDGSLLRLEVRDWGRGFDPDNIAEDRFGLEGIRERTRLLGGQCSIESQPGEGTCVQVTLPIVEPK